MFNTVEYVRSLAKERRIPISRLEQDLGFSNGYLNPKKLTRLPYDRAKQVAEYLRVPLAQILGEEPPAPRPMVTEEDIKFALFGGEGEITDEMYNEVKQFAAYIKQRNRKDK